MDAYSHIYNQYLVMFEKNDLKYTKYFFQKCNRIIDDDLNKFKDCSNKCMEFQNKKKELVQNYLEQIFQQLKKAKLVRAIRGPGGGYVLDLHKKDISIISIIDAVEENTKMTRCSVDQQCLKNGTKCQTHDLWQGLSNRIRTYLAAVSIADVLEHRLPVDESLSLAKVV